MVLVVADIVTARGVAVVGGDIAAAVGVAVCFVALALLSSSVLGGVVLVGGVADVVVAVIPLHFFGILSAMRVRPQRDA